MKKFKNIEKYEKKDCFYEERLGTDPSGRTGYETVKQHVTMTTCNCSFFRTRSNMADVEGQRSASCPVPLDRKLSSDPLPNDDQESQHYIKNEESDGMTDEQLEQILIERAKDGDKLAKFQLGQFYFEREIFDKALVAFERIKNTDLQAKYQLGVMYYDGLGTKHDPVCM